MSVLDPKSVRLTVSTRFVARLFTFIIGFLLAADLFGQVARYRFGCFYDRYWWIAIFNVDREQNIPTYYQGATIFIAAILLGVISILKWMQADRFRIAWTVLCGLFLLLSMDEMCSMHEQLMEVIARAGYHPHGLLSFSWVIPGLIFVAVVGALFIPFVFHFPKPIRIRIILAGAIYVGGALGMEMVSGWYSGPYGKDNLGMAILNAIEEGMEMTGMALFTVALVRYIAENYGIVTFNVVMPVEASPAVQSSAWPVPARRELRPSRPTLPHSGLTPS